MAISGFSVVGTDSVGISTPPAMTMLRPLHLLLQCSQAILKVTVSPTWATASTGLSFRWTQTSVPPSFGDTKPNPRFLKYTLMVPCSLTSSLLPPAILEDRVGYIPSASNTEGWKDIK